MANQTNGWTPDRRARQAMLIHSWAPWQHSTGPRSEKGKACSARNAYKGGRRGIDRDALRNLGAILSSVL